LYLEEDAVPSSRGKAMKIEEGNDGTEKVEGGEDINNKVNTSISKAISAT
jgi:hypothetical protein